MATLLVVVGSIPAQAQSLDSMTGSQTEVATPTPESNGISVGRGRLHPALQLDSHYLVNPGRLPGESPQRTNEIYFAVRPGFDLDLPLAHDLVLSAKGHGEYQRFLDVAAYSAFSGQLDASLAMDSGGMMSFSLNNLLARASEPGMHSSSAASAPSADVTQVGAYRLANVANQATLNVEVKPGGGALVLSGAYAHYIVRYDDVGDTTLLDQMSHTPSLKAEWRFLPKTSMFLEGTTQLSQFQGSNVDAHVWDAVIGMNGAVTPKMSGLLKAGYSRPFNTLEPSAGTVVGQVEGTWHATEWTNLRAGFVRASQPVIFYQFVTLMRPYVRVEQAIGSRVTLTGAAQYSYNNFARAADPTLRGAHADERIDKDLTASLAVDFHASEFLVFSMVNAFDLRRSNHSAPAASGATTVDPLSFDYTAHDVTLRAAFRY